MRNQKTMAAAATWTEAAEQTGLTIEDIDALLSEHEGRRTDNGVTADGLAVLRAQAEGN